MCHVEEEVEGLVVVVVAGFGEGGDEGGVNDDVWGGREGEEEAVGVAEEVELEVGEDEGGEEVGCGVLLVELEEDGVDGPGDVGVGVASG